MRTIGDSSIPVTTTVLQGNLLDDRSHLGLFFGRSLALQRSIETCATHRNQLADALDAQAALQKHYLLDLLEDPVSPVSPLCSARNQKSVRNCDVTMLNPLKICPARIFAEPGWVLRVAELTLAQYAHLEGIPKDWREWHPSIRKARALSESLFKSWGEALLFRTLAILRLGRVRSGSLRNSACE